MVLKIKHIFLILLISTLVSCGGRSYTFMADPIFASCAKEMKKKRGYELRGTGGSIPNYDVRTLFISFKGVYNVNILQARRLYVEAVENLLQKVNSNIKIKPYLHNYPATWENIDLFLSFSDQYKNPTKAPNISFVYFARNKVCYAIFDYKIRQYVKVYEEPYEETLRIIQNEQTGHSVTTE